MAMKLLGFDGCIRTVDKAKIKILILKKKSDFHGRSFNHKSFSKLQRETLQFFFFIRKTDRQEEVLTQMFILCVTYLWRKKKWKNMQAFFGR